VAIDRKTSNLNETLYEYTQIQKGGYLPDKNGKENAIATVMIKSITSKNLYIF
jgi:hypothetical protein